MRNFRESLSFVTVFKKALSCFVVILGDHVDHACFTKCYCVQCCTEENQNRKKSKFSCGWPQHRTPHKGYAFVPNLPLFGIVHGAS